MSLNIEDRDRDLYLILDTLSEALKEQGFTGLTTETLPEYRYTFLIPDEGRACLDDIEARLGIDVTELRTAYNEWVTDYL